MNKQTAGCCHFFWGHSVDDVEENVERRHVASLPASSVLKSMMQ